MGTSRRRDFDPSSPVIGLGLDMLDRRAPGWSDRLLVALAVDGRSLTRRTLEEFSSRSLRTRADDRAATAPAVIAIEPGIDPSNLSRIIEVLSESLTPALVLCDPEHTMVRSLLSAEGIACEPTTTSPETAAVIVRTLACRQHAIERQNADLRMSELAIRGVQSEVNTIHDELQSAASIQRQCMPDALPESDALELGVIFRPASYVSGDIYDVERLDEHRTALFLADAVGHGVPAALMTMIITQGLRKTDGDAEKRVVVEPHDALRRLNATMLAHPSEHARFATAVYAIHDARTNEVTIAGAGHPPTMLVRSGTGRVEYIESGGPLLGIFDEPVFEPTTLTLAPGDLMIMYTDGFEVAFPEGHDAHDRALPNETYLTRMREAAQSGGISDAARFLEDSLDQQSGSLNQRDDITALFLSPRPEPVRSGDHPILRASGAARA